MKMQASLEDMGGSGGSPLPSEMATGSRAVACAGAGLANDTGDNHCFLNAIIQVKEQPGIQMRDTARRYFAQLPHGHVPGM